MYTQVNGQQISPDRHNARQPHSPFRPQIAPYTRGNKEKDQ